MPIDFSNGTTAIRRKIYAGVDHFDQILLRVKNKSRPNGEGGFSIRQGFQGFQDKMASMLTYYLYDAGLIDPPEFPIPVDFHVMRVMVANEIVRFPNLPASKNVYSEQLLETLRRILLNYTRRHNVDPRVLANALWLQSNTLCNKHPGNITLNSAYNARSTILTPYEPDWQKNGDRKAHSQSCGACPLQRTCKFDVPNAPYTRKGQLLVLRKRTRPNQLVLPLN